MTMFDTSVETRAYRFIQPLFDLVSVAVAWEVALSVSTAFGHGVAGDEPGRELAPSVWVVLLLWIFAALWLKVYRTRDQRSALLLMPELVSLLGIIAAGAVLSYEFADRPLKYVVLLFVLVSFLMLIGGRYVFLFLAATARRIAPLQDRIAVLGTGTEARLIAESIRMRSGGGAVVAGIILPENGAVDSCDDAAPVLGTTRRVAEVINKEKLDRIIIANGCATEHEIEECCRVSKRMQVIVSRTIQPPAPDARVEFTTLYGIPMLDMRPVAFTRRQELVKRAFDIVIASTLLAVQAPLLALTAILIKVTSEGPVLYRSSRVGQGGRHFTFLKFRSMYVNLIDRRDLASHNENGGHLFKIRRDPRITPLGRIMRRFSIDELPQLVNVILGQMSLVGPRPLPSEDLDPDGMSTRFAVWAEQRARVLPGITGLWQIRGRSDVPFEQMMELDIEYIKNWSLLLDLKITLYTPIVMLSGRGAY
jgi:exopolysaccharide biosynthesis polyprenyl glycosylphosphotransferase